MAAKNMREYGKGEEGRILYDGGDVEIQREESKSDKQLQGQEHDPPHSNKHTILNHQQPKAIITYCNYTSKETPQMKTSMTLIKGHK